MREARVYRECGLDGVMLENMHDVPYVRGGAVGPEVTACMTRVCADVRQAIGGDMPLGVQILAGMLANHAPNFTLPCSPSPSPSLPLPLPSLSLPGANREALAVAKAADADFVRAEGFVFSHIGDEGWMDSCAGELLRYRRNISADLVLVFTDIKKKHRFVCVETGLIKDVSIPGMCYPLRWCSLYTPHITSNHTYTA